jgi:mono/diheme cytochrome c family protein
MNPRLRHMALIWAVPVLLGVAVGLGGSQFLPLSVAEQAAHQSSMAPARFAAINVSLPASAVAFPDGRGSDIANANCLICHSAGMVLRQPPLTVEEWKTEIKKMKMSFGAPIPQEQIDALADYLGSINGRPSDVGPATVDSQAN